MLIGYSRVWSAPVELGIKNFAAYSDKGGDAAAALAVPAGITAGSTLVAAVRFGFWNGTGPTVITPPPGWSLVGSDTSSTGFYVYKKTADGTEGGTSAVWGLNADFRAVFAFAEISGAAGNVEASFAPAALDPPAHVPVGGAAETVWIAVTTVRSNNNDVTAAPAGYGGLVKEWTAAQGYSNSGQTTLGAAHRKTTAPSEDPGAFAWTGAFSSNPQACTISVR